MNSLDLSLKGAYEASAQGRIEEWVHAFLTGPGDNQALSDGLRLFPRWWLGPIHLELKALQPCCGPDEGLEYVVDRERFMKYTGRMCESICAGWEPPPLIAHYRGAGVLSLRDGNHRYAALCHIGVSTYPTIIWFDSSEDLAGYEGGERHVT